MQTSLTKRLKECYLLVQLQEIYRIFPLFSLLFLVSFIYNILRPLKLSLVVTAPNSGADIIPFLKLWAILPASFFFAYLYTKLSSTLNRINVFYSLIGIFLGFFLIFAIMYPYQTYLECDFLADLLGSILPKGLHGLTALVRYWFLALFYVMAELWGSMILTLLAWGFANESISVKQAKHSYALLAVGADSAGIFSGQFANLIRVKNFNPLLPYGNTAWEQTLITTLLAVIAIGIVIILLYRYNSLKAQNNTTVITNKKEENIIKMSIIDCLKYTFRSPYMLCLTAIVVSYFMSFNLFDVIWTHQLKLHFTKTSDFNYYSNHITSIVGILAASMAFFISGNVLRKLGWRCAALVTPVVMLITALGFFPTILCEQHPILDFIFNLFKSPISNIIIFFGTIQYCLTRACKYAIFDATKEIAFIPLSIHEKRQGKVVIDTIVSRFSKSGSAVLFHGLLLFCGNLAATTPYVAAIIFITIAIWIFAVYTLNKVTSKTIDQEYFHSVTEENNNYVTTNCTIKKPGLISLKKKYIVY